MKKMLFSMILLVSAGVSATESTLDSRYYEIQSVKVQEVQMALPSDYYPQQVNPISASEEISAKIKAAEVIIDQVVNLGQKVWSIVEKGSPTVNFQVNSANALPMGITQWNQLAGWNIPQSKTYHVTYTNLFGMDVVDFTFRVEFVAGGSFNGLGKYVSQAKISPAQINVMYGFNLDAVVEASQAYNHGTTENPVGGVQLSLKWKVQTPFQYKEQTEVFYMTGDNNLVHLQ